MIYGIVRSPREIVKKDENLEKIKIHVGPCGLNNLRMGELIFHRYDWPIVSQLLQAVHDNKLSSK